MKNKAIHSLLACLNEQIRLNFDFLSIIDMYFNCLRFSGLLVSYLSLKAMKKCQGAKKFKWGMFYFHRFWRYKILISFVQTCFAY